MGWMNKNHFRLALPAAVLVIVLISCSLGFCRNLKHSDCYDADIPFTAVLQHQTDGDSFIVTTTNNSEQIAIRLWGIDAPEFDQPHSSASKKALEQLLTGKSIVIYPKYVDRFGRLVATAEIGNIVVNSVLIEYGHAWVHPYFCDEKICDRWYRLQKKAQLNQAGLWADIDPVEPWVWKMKK